MAKLTVSEIKRQIAALEAKAAHLTEVEMKSSVAKVRSLMASLGVTIEHLGSRVSSAATSVKMAVVRKAAPARKSQAKRAGAGVPKFKDPKTGKTWTGMGKPPAWIASAKNRDKFRIDGADASATNSDVPNALAKKATGKAGRKVATKVKSVAKKVVRATKANASVASAPVKKTLKTSSAAKKVAVVKKATSPKAVAKKASAKRVAAKSAAAPASAGAVTPAADAN
ncbi:MAG: H-NS histone family protein [Pseudomonadota bacterium]|nr:H-NS histone family protein [Pseudomonadota bacterium]